VAIDVAKGEVKDRFVAEGAKFLNDLTSDKEGRVYASDMMGNRIWMLEDGKLSVLVEDETLSNPNGLLAEDGRLLVGSWGKMGEGFATEVPGHMRVVDLKTKKVSDLGDPTPAGNLDGIEPDGKGGYIVSDWMKGALLRVGPDGKAEPLLTLKQGSADLGMIPGKDVVLVPMMMEGELAAYKLD
jgi:sugar lactone lactonase YvrE